MGELASLLSKTLAKAAATDIPPPLPEFAASSSFLIDCHKEPACTAMIRLLGRRMHKGQFEDLYPTVHPLLPMHTRSLALSAKLASEHVSNCAQSLVTSMYLVTWDAYAQCRVYSAACSF